MFTPDQLDKIAKSLPLKKVGRPKDIANAVLFLASNAVAGHVTGQVLSVSGGYSMAG
jgi:NAD(P)-dependent dehydrogenase (short-subunit alcohol dehydrogenase family)